MGKVTITLNVPDGMEEIVRQIIEREAKLIIKRLSGISFETTFGILKGKRIEVRRMEADTYDEWEV